MQVDLLLLHKALFNAQELPCVCFLGLEIFLLPDHFDPKYLPQCVKPVFTTLSKKLPSLNHGGLHFRLKAHTRRRTFRLKGSRAP